MADDYLHEAIVLYKIFLSYRLSNIYELLNKQIIYVYKNIWKLAISCSSIICVVEFRINHNISPYFECKHMYFQQVATKLHFYKWNGVYELTLIQIFISEKALNIHFLNTKDISQIGCFIRIILGHMKKQKLPNKK